MFVGFVGVAVTIGAEYHEIGKKQTFVACLITRGADPDQVIDLRAVLQAHHHETQISDMPETLRPRKGKLGLQDYEKIFCADQRPGKNIYDLRGVDRKTGCIVVIRPDQYVAQILPLDGLDTLEEFFGHIFAPCS